MQRMLLVAKKYEAALLAAASGVAYQAGRDVYQLAKDRLRQQGIAVEDRTMNPSEVPAHMSSWSHGG